MKQVNVKWLKEMKKAALTASKKNGLLPGLSAYWKGQADAYNNVLLELKKTKQHESNIS